MIQSLLNRRDSSTHIHGLQVLYLHREFAGASQERINGALKIFRTLSCEYIPPVSLQYSDSGLVSKDCVGMLDDVWRDCILISVCTLREMVVRLGAAYAGTSSTAVIDTAVDNR